MLVFPHAQVRCAHLVLVVEQLGELGHGACGQLGVVLVVDEVDDGCLELLRGLGQTLHVGHLRLVRLHRQDLGAAPQRLREHGGTNPLGSGGGLRRWWRGVPESGTSVEKKEQCDGEVKMAGRPG